MSFGGNVAQFLSCDKDTFFSDQLELIQNLELILEALHVVLDDYECTKLIASWSNSIGLRGLGVLTELSTNALTNKKKSKEHRIIVGKLLFLNRCMCGFLVGTSSLPARQLLFSTCVAQAMQVLLYKTIDLDASRLALSVIMSAINAIFGEEKKVPDDYTELYVPFIKLMSVICDVFNRYFKHCEEKKLFVPKRTFTQLFPPAYPFPELTVDSTVKDESIVEVLVEMSVIVATLSKMHFEVDNPIVVHYVDVIHFTGNLSALDAIVGLEAQKIYSMDTLSSENQLREDKHLSVITLAAMRKMCHPTYFPGAKWITLKAFCNEAYSSFLSLCKNIIYIPPPEEPEAFDYNFWTDYIYITFKCSTSKSSSIEHLSAIPQKACFNITNDTRDVVSEAMYFSWNRLGWDASEEEKQRFGLLRFGGYQRKLYAESEDDFRIVYEILLCCMQRNTELVCIKFS
ncbi:unnamed protein product [Ambrosiozyma monospora]|uniref:Unnamed protein product n=1 Tax=Ambrosiozyma monospora TaxID=43982 RepID=A0A9W7DPN3_AMBMO|nr:unnamed protein product [Ambrosiozyma monospora]